MRGSRLAGLTVLALAAPSLGDYGPLYTPGEPWSDAIILAAEKSFEEAGSEAFVLSLLGPLLDQAVEASDLAFARRLASHILKRPPTSYEARAHVAMALWALNASWTTLGLAHVERAIQSTYHQDPKNLPYSIEKKARAAWGSLSERKRTLFAGSHLMRWLGTPEKR